MQITQLIVLRLNILTLLHAILLFSNPKRVQNSIRTQKNLRRLDEIYLIDSSGTILLGDTNNPEDEFKPPTEEEFDLALEGKPVSITDSAEDKTQIDIIYEDQDTRTVSAIVALQQRELHPEGGKCDYEEAFAF